MLRSKIADYEERLKALDGTLGGNESSTNVHDLVRLEQEVLESQKTVEGLARNIRGFEGLPPDRDAARKEVRRLEKEVEGLKSERDSVFAAMVGE
jgi:HAUS augmin-like complex subunit 1